MKEVIIVKEASEVKSILNVFGRTNCPMRWSQFVAMVDTADGCLMWNTLTSALVLVKDASAEEIKQMPEVFSQSQVLTSAAFLVDKDINESKRLRELDAILKVFRKSRENAHYTILTTLNCNARCYYCYEKGYATRTMNEKTAEEVAEFIISRNKGKKERISWFGGEPLVNKKAIEIISRKLKEAGIDLKATMISNGYLFNEETVTKAKQEWNIEDIQITLDGTEEVYNRTKAYVGAEGNPYQRVLHNIDLLLEAGIGVSIRMNLSLENADDLIKLAKELDERFKGKNKLSVYAHLLYEYNETTPKDQSEVLIAKYKELNALLISTGRKSEKRLPKHLPINHCMADSDDKYVIMPEGRLGKCEHYGNSDFIGDIWQGITDHATIERFKERENHGERCEKCLFAPTCTLLTMCADSCHDIYLEVEKINLENRIRKEYKRWKKKQQAI